MKRFTVLGTGGWGTAMAELALQARMDVTLWGRDPEYVNLMNRTRENPRALPGARISQKIQITSDAAEAVRGAELIFIAIPTQFLRATLGAFAGRVPERAVLLSGVKGIEIGTYKKPSEVFAETIGTRPWGVLSGPSHAEEIMCGLPVSITMASADLSLAKAVRDALASDNLRIYAEGDAIGVELAGALKNVMAVAAGVSDGLELGDNAKAALVTRALAEMTRYGVARGANAQTYAGLAGIGDLITTCYSKHGRNRGVGERIARGETLDTVLKSTTQVAEGVWTVRALRESAASPAAFSSELPICSEVNAILYEGKPPRKSVHDLMTRPPREK
ncbi:MAG: NAD(P)-dependent glycerol-3-phosphate dehydrogenase [Planctomycetes bacterium]|nr:NAD(P)-dependent glycerol-3-phosphate dehydrogenase [Planctomycetota bacterium]